MSDKIGVLLSELGEQEDVYAARLDESRAVLKVVRNTERSVQPSRDGKRKVAEEIQRLKIREPQSARLVTLEQELVRAEAENLVAEAQLGNVVCFLFVLFLSFFFLLEVLFCGVEYLPTYGDVVLMDGNRPGRNSRRRTRSTSSPPSSALRSRPSWHGTGCGCCSCWMIRPWYRVTCGPRTHMLRRRGRS